MKIIKNTFIFAVLSAFIIGTAQADFIGLNITSSHWAPSLSGSFNSKNGGSSSIDFGNGTNGVNMDDSSHSSVSFTLEHPIPILPNVRYQQLDLDSSGRIESSSIQFDGSTFNSGTLNTDFDLSHEDIVLYYEVLDNYVSLDLGIDLKLFDGRVALDDGTNSKSLVIDATIPLFYVSARIDLPLSGYYLGANINSNIGIGDNSADDSSFVLGYESTSGLGVEGGYRYFSLKLDDNNLKTDLKYDGVYLNGYYHF